ncbi:four helix bundle protein [Candidatus Falkowbacteria bacterium]|nr:four helix bundle protein [Candidatus Falkowbacteria bacterium]
MAKEKTVISSKFKTQSSNQVQIPNDKKPYDLENRTAKFGEDIIVFIKIVPDNPIHRSLKQQLIRSATSIGANYMEADATESKKDFKYKIALCKKEAKESMHWLRMIATAQPEYKQSCRILWQEAHELVLIFSTIISGHKRSQS